MTIPILIALSVYAIHIIMNEYPLFAPAIRQMDYSLPEILTKPLYSCPMCMCMTWGVLLYFLPCNLVVLTILSAFTLNKIYAEHSTK